MPCPNHQNISLKNKEEKEDVQERQLVIEKQLMKKEEGQDEEGQDEEGHQHHHYHYQQQQVDVVYWCRGNKFFWY